MACERMLKLGPLTRKYLLSKKLPNLFFEAHSSGGKTSSDEKKYPKSGMKIKKIIEPDRKVAIVLSGCGTLDGTEIHEAAATAVHVSKNQLYPEFYAPYCPQADVIDHKTGEAVCQQRNALTEAARIARGRIKCLSDLNPCEAGGVIFPGGFGVGKTLCTYAQDQANFNLNRDVMRILMEFQEAQKPMGFMCISSVLPARMFPSVRITLGMRGEKKKWPHCEAIEHAEEMGAFVEPRLVDDFSFDKQYLVFSTPAFMYNGTYNEIFEGIGLMVDMMSKIIN